jgi:rod shape-determining protein MreB
MPQPEKPASNIIVNIGDCTTEIAITSPGGITFSKSIGIAGDEFDNAIISYMKRAYNLLIGERTAREIKLRIGSAYPLDKELSMEAKGRDAVAGLPTIIHLTSQEIRKALNNTISAIVDAVCSALDRCPLELSADLVDRGFVMAGSGSLIRGFEHLLSEKTGLRVIVAKKKPPDKLSH